MSEKRLNQLLNFNDQDLENNRQGMLSEAQQQRLRNRFLRGKRTLQIAIILTFVPLILLAVLPQFPLICSGYLGGVLFFWVVIYRLLRWDENRALIEVNEGYVGIVEGLPRRVHERTTRWDPDARGSQTHVQQYVMIGNTKFAVPRRVQESFQEYTHYRVYYLPESYVIVAAEALDTPPAFDAIPFDRLW